MLQQSDSSVNILDEAAEYCIYDDLENCILCGEWRETTRESFCCSGRRVILIKENHNNNKKLENDSSLHNSTVYTIFNSFVESILFINKFRAPSEG